MGNSASKKQLVGIGVSVLAHVGIVAGISILGMWKTDKITAENQQEPLTYIEPQGGSGSPPPAGARAKSKVAKAAKRRVVKAQTQPETRQIENADDNAGGDSGEESGNGNGGSGGGDGSGDGQGIGDGMGDLLGDGTGTPQVKKTAPKVVAPSVLNSKKISGNEQIRPPARVRTEMVRAGQNRLVAVAKLCTDAGGSVSSVKLLRSTAYPAYDRVILRELRTWRYRPVRIAGQAVAVCTSITVIYSME